MSRFKNLAAKVADKSAVIGGTALGTGAYLLQPVKALATPPAASGLVDWDDAAAQVQAEMSPALQAAIVVGMIVVGIIVSYAIFKRFVRG